ncbi:NusG domain II-containing protein [Clostridium peptidivorans]|uniref:NusG domain II-containing protein n=1 Tax=Clostridium peptidivorans TaxID=100174 RepID=UPI000BE27B4E|nr:NusG domain II-containing protein [Clostridium peptidivorans]
MKKGDKILFVIVIAVLLIASIGTYAYKLAFKDKDKIAVIKENGKVVKTINLSKLKGTEKFDIKSGDHFNTIVVENNKISIIDADCPDKVCIKTGWISDAGQSIVCLPNKVIVSIEGEKTMSKTPSDIDGASY